MWELLFVMAVKQSATAIGSCSVYMNGRRHLQGAISEIISPQPATSDQIITAGADGSVAISDGRMGLKASGRVKLTDFPYSLTAIGGLAVCGCGDGSLHVIDVASATTLYALGAQKAAVRTALASSSQLVSGGDDGSVICFDMMR